MGGGRLGIRYCAAGRPAAAAPHRRVSGRSGPSRGGIHLQQRPPLPPRPRSRKWGKRRTRHARQQRRPASPAGTPSRCRPAPAAPRGPTPRPPRGLLQVARTAAAHAPPLPHAAAALRAARPEAAARMQCVAGEWQLGLERCNTALLLQFTSEQDVDAASAKDFAHRCGLKIQVQIHC